MSLSSRLGKLEGTKRALTAERDCICFPQRRVQHDGSGFVTELDLNCNYKLSHNEPDR